MLIDRRLFLCGTSAFMVASGAPALAALPAMTVTKTPTCGCCTAWADLASQAGYAVTTVDMDDVSPVKRRLGVPRELWGCHTAEIDGYVVEGHVPFDAVARLLDERPDVTGIAAPGMPMGSPGMGWDPEARYDVFAFGGEAGTGELFHRAGVAG